MTASISIAERHAFGLETLAEMTGKLVQVAYQRAMRPGEPDEQDRAMLLFDRLARGFRLTIALEARMDRDRRRDAAGIAPETAPSAKTGLPPLVAGPRPQRPARETDHEEDCDLEPSDLPGHIRALRRMVAEDADILDPDGTHAATLDRWAGSKLHDSAEPRPRAAEPARPALKLPPRRASAARRATGPPDP